MGVPDGCSSILWLDERSMGACHCWHRTCRDRGSPRRLVVADGPIRDLRVYLWRVRFLCTCPPCEKTRQRSKIPGNLHQVESATTGSECFVGFILALSVQPLDGVGRYSVSHTMSCNGKEELMPYFTVNKNAQAGTGDHEVHDLASKRGCLPSVENRTDLGLYASCSDAAVSYTHLTL